MRLKMLMDSIIAKGLKFMACHGVLAEEKTQKQEFIVDVELFYDLSVAGVSDDLNDSINYDKVYQQVKKIVENEQYNLIEALAENIAASLLMLFPIESLELSLYKPQAPVIGDFEYFAVKIYRKSK